MIVYERWWCHDRYTTTVVFHRHVWGWRVWDNGGRHPHGCLAIRRVRTVVQCVSPWKAS